MGLVHAEITLRNVGDVTSVNRGYIKEPEIRQTTVTAMVDTGAATLVINEALRRQLGLAVESKFQADPRVYTPPASRKKREVEKLIAHSPYPEPRPLFPS